MEMLDVRDESGVLTGRTVARGTELSLGEYLVQQRAIHLKSAPGAWATTVGYVLSGEDSINGAIRETGEELGLHLSPAQFTLFERHILENRIEDVWFANISKDEIPVLGSEVMAWKWASKQQLRHLIQLGEFFEYSYFSRLPEAW